MINSFDNLTTEYLTSVLKQSNITTPTQIQQKSIPPILEGKDVYAKSTTGTGKTLCFLLPVIQNINFEIKNPQAVILTPTHELAVQIKNQADLLMKDVAALIIGGASKQKQLEQLKQKPKIIIGSSGRILELVKLKKLTMHFVKTIVIDEADAMLNEKNIENVLSVVKTTLKDRQLLFFSATTSKDTISLAKKMSKDLQVVSVNETKNISHGFFVCEKRDKIDVLRKIIYALKIEKAIVFINDANELEILSKRLNFHGIKASPLYGEKLKNERKKALLDFREGRIKILLASDIAARGLDIKNITYIINMDVPYNETTYLHRIGRTGRMGLQGVAFSIATPSDISSIKKIGRRLNINFEEKQVKNGLVVEVPDYTEKK